LEEFKLVKEFGSGLKLEFENFVNSYGNQVRFKYYTNTIGSTTYDDDSTLAITGTSIWTSGIITPIKDSRGSYDAILIEQGKIQITDRIIYISSDIQTSGIWKVGIGSPVAREYCMTEGGVILWENQGVNVYKKVYVKELTTGSLYGE